MSGIGRIEDAEETDNAWCGRFDIDARKGGRGVLCQSTCVLAMSLDDSSVHIVGCSGTKGDRSGVCLRFPCSFSPRPSLLPVHIISFRPMRGIFFEVMTSRPAESGVDAM